MNSAIFQIGKAGVTQEAINSLNLIFKNHSQVRISLLKSSGRNRENIKSIAEDICNKMPKIENKEFSYKIIGFKIIISRYSKKK